MGALRGESYRTIWKPSEIEIVIQKSRFIGRARPVSSAEEALDFIEGIRSGERMATHHCYAYVCGNQRNEKRFSDDGEPQGTAGIPMLEVLDKQELTDLCVVVTRYFGGIKLGAGGLIRAYTRGASEAVEAAVVVENRPFLRVTLTMEYSLIGRVDNYLQESDIVVSDKTYEEKVRYEFFVLEERQEEIFAELMDLSGGTVDLAIGEMKILSTRNGKVMER